MSAYRSVETHRSMLFDDVRNRAYNKAIRDTVAQESVVLDLGAGLGIHGLLAAAAGAKKVILLDASPVVDLCTEVAGANGLSERTEVIRLRLEDIENLDAVDVMVSVFTGNFLLSEDLLPLLISARDRFLKPDGVMIPSRARMMAALVTAPSFHENRVAIWSKPAMGMDFSCARRFAANTVFFASIDDIDAGLLSAPKMLRDLDFHTATSADCRSEVEFEVSLEGCCHGLLGWFDMKLGSDWISTGPQAEPMHWSVAFLPLDPPLDFSPGERVTLKLDRPEFGEWTWTVSRGGDNQCHSTFHSNLVDLSYLKKTQLDTVPGIGNRGELALLVLSQMAEGRTVSEIIARARNRFPILAERDPLFEKRIRSLVAEFGAGPG